MKKILQDLLMILLCPVQGPGPLVLFSVDIGVLPYRSVRSLPFLFEHACNGITGNVTAVFSYFVTQHYFTSNNCVHLTQYFYFRQCHQLIKYHCCANKSSKFIKIIKKLTYPLSVFHIWWISFHSISPCNAHFHWFKCALQGKVIPYSEIRTQQRQLQRH